MSACKQSLVLLKQLRAAVTKVAPQAKELSDLLELHQNDGDPCFNEVNWGTAYEVVQMIRSFNNKLDHAIEAGEVTVVGRRKKR